MGDAVLTPITQKDAFAFIVANHSHNDEPVGWIGGTSVEIDGQRAAVGVLGRPEGRGLQDGRTAAATRVATTCAPNVCSMVYGALCRMAEAAGYWDVVTYTLASECGSCVKAAGFVAEAERPARDVDSFDTPSRPRARQGALFPTKKGRPKEAKVRWRRHVARSRRSFPRDATGAET
jgi:hypothetical protein